LDITGTETIGFDILNYKNNSDDIIDDKLIKSVNNNLRGNYDNNYKYDFDQTVSDSQIGENTKSQFDFLKGNKKLKKFYVECLGVEKVSRYKETYSSACMISRKALEVGIKWIYMQSNINADGEKLGNLIYHYNLQNIVTADIFEKIKYIQKTGNMATHTTEKITKSDVTNVVNSLVEFAKWMNDYSKRLENFIVDNRFNKNTKNYANLNNNNKKSSSCFVSLLKYVLIIGVITVAIIYVAGIIMEKAEKKEIALFEGIKTDGKNIVKNPGAESKLKYWESTFEKNSSLAGEEPEFSTDDGEPFSGKKCFCIYPKFNNYQIKQTIKMTKGKEYLVSMFTKVSGTKSDIKLNFLYKLTTEENEIQIDVPTQNNWKLQKKLIKVPDDLSTSSTKFSIIFASNANEYYIDDIKIEMVTTNKEKATESK
jgi:hypothetical protein